MQRTCACGNHTSSSGGCEECTATRHGTVQRTPANPAWTGIVPPIAHDVLASRGQPLDAATRSFMEPRFGHDFSHVRVHADAKAAESARVVTALAYTVGRDVVFGAGQLSPTSAADRRLMAHELTHVVQQQEVPARSMSDELQIGASSDTSDLEATAASNKSSCSEAVLKVGDPDDRAEREADQVADVVVSGGMVSPSIASPGSSAAPPVMLRRQPKTQVRVQETGSTTIKQLAQGKGGSGAVVYEYSAHGQKAPEDEDIAKPGRPFDITLPLLIYPPAVLDPPKIDLFVFFHGMRADYGEGKRQGSEPIALWSHLQEAVAGTDRLGIAAQAPATWQLRDKEIDDPENKGKKKTVKVWKEVTAQWHEALANVGFDGLVKIALERLKRDLGLSAALVPGEIHVAGHSAGGLGIIEATKLTAGAKTFGDKVQDVTLQDAGYGASWLHVINWFLDGSPGKTVRVLMSQSEGGTPAKPGDTRSVLVNWFNVKKINEIIATKKKTDTLKAEEVNVPDPKAQKPRPGGLILESQLVVKNLKTGANQGTMVAFFAPGGGHYETVTATMGAAAAAGAKTTADFLGEAKPGKFRVISRQTAVFEDKDLSKPLKQAATGTGGKAADVVLSRDTMVEVTALEIGTPPKTAPTYMAKIQSAGIEGWTPLASLAPPTAPH